MFTVTKLNQKRIKVRNVRIKNIEKKDNGATKI